MAPQPSASWKLKAISVPFCSVHTMSVSVPIPSAGIAHNLDILSYPVVSDSHRLSRSSSLEVSVRARPRNGHIVSLHPIGKRRISMKIQYGEWMMSSSRVARWRRQHNATQHNTILTLTRRPVQNPVPRSNQSLFLSSYTFTRLRSFAGAAAWAIIVKVCTPATPAWVMRPSGARTASPGVGAESECKN
jgi:hypothetical protein